MSFSERIGLKQRPPIQLESMDEALRNGLFNIVHPFLLEGLRDSRTAHRRPWQNRFNSMWSDFFRLPLYKSPANYAGDAKPNAFIHEFFRDAEWNRVYDAVEYLVELSTGSLSEAFNAVLEREVAGYRILNGVVTPISDASQLGAIQSGLDASGEARLSSVNSHLATSLRLLSDRENPDYRNSIKEAISAVESLTSIVTDKTKPDLKDALRELEQSGTLHPALKGAFQKLYGWTSDENGVRHALMEASPIDFADAQFMLVACSAFVYFIVAKLAHSEGK